MRRPVSVIEFAAYRRRAGELLTAEQDAIVDVIAYDPTCGEVIPGTGGLRKVRIGCGEHGKRGGARVIYYFLQCGLSDPPVGALYQEREGLPERSREEEAWRRSEGDHRTMAKKKLKNRLADDLLESLNEARGYFAGKRTGAVVRRVVPRESDAREARLKLGLSQREFASFIGTAVGTVRKWELGTRRPSGAARTLIELIKREPKAVRRAVAKANSAA